MSLSKWRFPLLALLLVVLAVSLATAQNNQPVEVVESFYDWYIDYTGYDEEADTFRNPITDGAFRERPELSPELIASIEAEEMRFADPFVCAQDVPTGAEYEAVGENAVLVREYFGENPHAFTHLVELAQTDSAWQITAVHCQEAVTAKGTVETFYTAAVTDQPNLQIAGNPLLSDALIARLAEELGGERGPGSGDPVLCAQDFPQSVIVNLIGQGEDTASMLVSEYFAGNPTPKLIRTDLIHNERWQIDTIHCEVTAADVAELLYHEYARFIRYDLDHNAERTPLADWSAYPWVRFMDQALYADLLAIYNNPEMLPADPFLCAQDIPVSFSTTAEGDGDAVTVHISGAYPSGPDTTESFELATVEMRIGDEGFWQMTDITCTP